MSYLNKGVVTLSFDDARKDTYHVMKDILLPRDLPGVVYVPTGYIETGFNDPAEIGYNGLMSKDDLDELNEADIFELSGHGHMHKNTNEDIELGIRTLRRWYPDNYNIGFASPHSHIKKVDVDSNMSFFKSINLSYVRGGRNFDKFILPKRILSLLARITKSPELFLQCYKSSIIKERSFFLRAVPVHKKTTFSQVKAIVDYCVTHKEWAILEFHGIDKVGTMEYNEEFCWDEENFSKLCDYLVKLKNDGEIMVTTPLEIVTKF